MLSECTRQKKIARLRQATHQLRVMLQACRCCGRECGVNRWEGQLGVCRTPLSLVSPQVRYASATLHFGEEPMLVGTGGSGTVFFTHCNLRCVFCQNYQISWEGLGRDATVDELARDFCELQRKGAGNINLVTATHCMYPVLLALQKAYETEVQLPLVFNTNGYEMVEFLRCLEGIVDIYLPDLKYMDRKAAARYSAAPNYPQIACEAIREMYRQVGPYDVETSSSQRGVILRHLVLPDNVAGTYDLLLWLKDEGLTDIPLSLMSQYTPQHRAADYPEIARSLSWREYEDVVQYALDLGFEHLLVQECESQNVFLPDFTRQEPFVQREETTGSSV
ncbi:MAG TPA: radical SAM protein [Candidatus Hydrogenedentes bacterium]|nr:radical SAM protein [Candidatus Hydrogenedentota bacterium]HOL76692.1 radical SAM protein [Candidatus Hydrogenedentota bacterium]HPO85347.1 radical SAM protein [Candidatus Hydrogenedentota bacterium]